MTDWKRNLAFGPFQQSLLDYTKNDADKMGSAVVNLVPKYNIMIPAKNAHINVALGLSFVNHLDESIDRCQQQCCLDCYQLRIICIQKC